MQVQKLPQIIFLSTLLLSSNLCIKINALTPRKINTKVTIISDMKSPHEAVPHGVPKHFPWVKGPRIHMGNNPKNNKAIMAWGQVYVPEQGNRATNTRVQIRNIKAYMLSKRDKKWRLIQNSTKVEGAAFREDFVANGNKPADIRHEKDGSISVKAGNGYNFHFWPKNGRATINPGDVGGIFTTVQARLIIDNPKKLDDRRRARYLLNMGGDYWLDSKAQWDNFKTNGEIGMGKFKYVATKWQAFNMTTLSPDEIRRNPPPLD
jgi:hypothetical protein